MKIIAKSSCGGGPCPTLYVGDNGNYYVQGFIVESSSKDGLDIPENEDLVRIDRRLIDLILEAEAK